VRRLTLFALAAALVACGSVAKAAFTQPEVRFRGWGVRSLSFDGATLEVRLLVANPNAYSFTTQKLDYTLFVDSTAVGLGGLDSAVVIPARDSTVVTFPVRVGSQALAAVGSRLLRGGEIPYRVQGDVVVRTFAGTFARRFDESGRYDAARGLRGN
jgi:LEA14-like dessication related protein